MRGEFSGCDTPVYFRVPKSWGLGGCDNPAPEGASSQTRGHVEGESLEVQSRVPGDTLLTRMDVGLLTGPGESWSLTPVVSVFSPEVLHILSLQPEQAPGTRRTVQVGTSEASPAG